MAPTTKTVGKKPLANKGSKNSTKSSSASAKNRISKKPAKPVQQKTKSTSSLQKKKKRKIYTDKELGIPRLNMITPVGVDLPKGKKKGKVFVDDQESMMAILAVVNASKDGQIESKMLKSRHLEEIREARRKEAEVRQAQRKSKLEETKDSLRRKRKRKLDNGPDEIIPKPHNDVPKLKTARKQVSFA